MQLCMMKKTDVEINIATAVVNARRLRIMLSNAIIDAIVSQRGGGGIFFWGKMKRTYNRCKMFVIQLPSHRNENYRNKTRQNARNTRNVSSG